MSSAGVAAIYAAVALTITSSAFGVAVARLFWAEDLEHAQRLQKIWDEHKAILEERIRIQDERLKLRESK